MWLRVDGHDTIPLSVSGAGADLWQGMAMWTPGIPGDHSLSVRAQAEDGEATSESIEIHVVAQPTPAPLLAAPTGTPGLMVTPLEMTAIPLGPVLELTADATSLAAGSCTFLRWRVSNVQPQSIDLDGQPVASEGSLQVCPCQTTTYNLIVLAEDKYVQSVTINVTGSCATSTPQPTRTPVPTPRPTNTPLPTSTPQALINFWAEATTVPAGSCTTIHWETANVQAVYFNGQGVAGVGTYRACPSTTCETYTLDVVLRDGSHDIRTLTICLSAPQPTQPPSTQPPPEDKTPPPAPVPIGPGSNNPNDPTQQCGTTVLRWNSVSDPSGIQGYRVNLQWYDGNQWQSSEPYFIIYGTSADVTQWTRPHEYLHTLRWAVWAIDNAGNHGPQSPWLYFACALE